MRLRSPSPFAVPAVLAVACAAALAAAAAGPRGEPPHAGEPPERPGLLGGPPGAAAAEGEEPASPRQPLAAWSSPATPAAAFAPGHVVVRFSAQVPEWQRLQIAQAAGGASFKSARRGSFVRVGVAAGDSAEALAARLGRMTGVVAAERDPIAYGLALGAVAAPAGRPRGNPAAGTGTVAAKRAFSDPLVPLQWSHERIRLAQALDRNATDGLGVIVAVIDSGVAFGDGASFPARRGLDLAGTRFLPGADFVDGGPPFDEGVSGGGPNSVRFGHGTFVASQIAATVDNGLAGASVAHRATILPVRVLNTGNSGSFSDVAEGIDFAVDSGARIINLSLGGPMGAGFLEASIARAHRAGVTIFASTGNAALSPSFDGDVLFPARYPQVIAVGATNFADARAGYSNFGPGLDFVAPAGDDPNREVGGGRRDAAVATSFLFDPVSGQPIYATFFATGTSFASPQAAGVAALLAALGVRDPEVMQRLLGVTARDLAAPGRDAETGEGLLDAFEAHRGFGFNS